MAQPVTSASAPPTRQMQAPAQEPPTEACPLCGAPLAADQEWCLRCGAAARTRLAATPNWKAPATTIAVVAALALGVLAAALVKLAGDSGPAPTPTTTTVTTPAQATGAPGASLPGAPPATAPSATVPDTTFPGATVPSRTTPRTPRTSVTPTAPRRSASPGLAGGTPAP
jgi:hypothetical protein